MVVAGHQPNYLPYLGFFHKLACVDHFMIVDTAQFVKRGTFGWMHRNKIRTQDGWQWLSLPVKTKQKRYQSCAEAELQNQENWRKKHWAAICYNYRQAPYFKDYAASFEGIYQQEWQLFSDLTVALIQVAANFLEISTPIKRASQCGISGESHELLEAICNYYGTNHYLSGLHGQDYLELDTMKKRGLHIEFQEFQHPCYTQCQPGEFLSGMCILDLLFNEGPRARTIVMSEKEH